MGVDIAKIVGLVLICGLKYVVGCFGLLALKLGFFESMLLSVLGGMIGVFAFANLGHLILPLLKKKKLPGKGVKPTKVARWLVRMRRSYGLAGIAILTPLLLQVPIGTIIAIKLVKDKRRVYLFMLVSFTLVSTIIYGTKYLIGTSP